MIDTEAGSRRCWTSIAREEGAKLAEMLLSIFNENGMEVTCPFSSGSDQSLGGLRSFPGPLENRVFRPMAAGFVDMIGGLLPIAPCGRSSF